MRKGFVDILLLFGIIFGLPIYIIITMSQEYNEEITNHIQKGGSILCNQWDNNGTFIRSIEISDYDGWVLTKNGIAKDGVSLSLIKCEKVIEIETE